MKGKLTPFLVAFLIWAAVSTHLLAHISVNPRTAEAGVHHKLFFIRAPVEQAIPVVELGLEVSEEWRNNGGDLNSFEHVPGWELDVEFDDEGKVTTVIWSGGEAPRETFQMFHMSMNVPEEPGDYTFKAWQKYADGKVVWFNEPRDGENEYPMPVVAVDAPVASAEGTTAEEKDEVFLSDGIVHLGSLAFAALALAVSLVSLKQRSATA